MATGCESDLERGPSDETLDFLCSVCKRKNKNTEGDQFCEDCHDYYCSTCVKFHCDVPALTNHKILNKAQFKPSSTDIFSRSQDTISQTSIKSYLSCSIPNLMKIKGKNRYSVKMPSEMFQCSICSVCVLADDTIIVADYLNSKVKRVDSISYTVTGFCGVSNYPSQVCAITDHDIAVSCSSSCVVEFISIGKTMQKTRKINVEFPCRGLAYAEKRLFVFDSKTSVYEYSESGDRQQQLSKNPSEKQIFSSICSVAISSDHSTIFVGDYNNGLIIMDRYGHLVGQFNGPELKGAKCVYLYKRASVLVCGYRSNSVLQFSLDGKLLGEVLNTDGCQAVCSNANNTKLIVGKQMDDIEVYDIDFVTEKERLAYNSFSI